MALSELEAQLAKTDRMFAPMCGTTQAVDIIGGGVKTNALPESAFFIMNHRIDVHRYVSLLLSLIYRYLSLILLFSVPCLRSNLASPVSLDQ